MHGKDPRADLVAQANQGHVVLARPAAMNRQPRRLVHGDQALVAKKDGQRGGHGWS